MVISSGIGCSSRRGLATAATTGCCCSLLQRSGNPLVVLLGVKEEGEEDDDDATTTVVAAAAGGGVRGGGMLEEEVSTCSISPYTAMLSTTPVLIAEEEEAFRVLQRAGNPLVLLSRCIIIITMLCSLSLW